MMKGTFLNWGKEVWEAINGSTPWSSSLTYWTNWLNLMNYYQWLDLRPYQLLYKTILSTNTDKSTVDEATVQLNVWIPFALITLSNHTAIAGRLQAWGWKGLSDGIHAANYTNWETGIKACCGWVRRWVILSLESPENGLLMKIGVGKSAVTIRFVTSQFYDQ
jgi:hypothetical protein